MCAYIYNGKEMVTLSWFHLPKVVGRHEKMVIETFIIKVTKILYVREKICADSICKHFIASLRQRHGVERMHFIPKFESISNMWIFRKHTFIPLVIWEVCYCSLIDNVQVLCSSKIRMRRLFCLCLYQPWVENEDVI